MPRNAPRPDYGQDAPAVARRLLGRGGVLLGLCLLLGLAAFAWRAPLLIVPALAALLPGAWMMAKGAVRVWSSRVGKLQARERMLSAVSWRGDEDVLDVGSGRGLLLVGAARRAPRGRAVGIDLWREEDLSGNVPQATRQNARLEGVEGRVSVSTADARALPFKDGRFDVVLSSLTYHNVKDGRERARAIQEAVRVLKPGGTISLMDIAYTEEYATLLREAGLQVDLSDPVFLYLRPTRFLVARSRAPEG